MTLSLVRDNIHTQLQKLKIKLPIDKKNIMLHTSAEVNIYIYYSVCVMYVVLMIMFDVVLWTGRYCWTLVYGLSVWISIVTSLKTWTNTSSFHILKRGTWINKTSKITIGQRLHKGHLKYSTNTARTMRAIETLQWEVWRSGGVTLIWNNITIHMNIRENIKLWSSCILGLWTGSFQRAIYSWSFVEKKKTSKILLIEEQKAEKNGL